MSNLLQRGATWLGGKLQAAGGRAVTYRRGTATVAITATPQMHNETVIEDGLPVEVVVYSWTVTASELLINSERIEPRAGDLIEETLNSEDIKWEVLPLDDKRKCWEWMDSSGLLLSIHTKRVE